MSASTPSPQSIAVSVIIATHNRASRLRETLDDLRAQQTPSGLGWEILVVDNGSTDATLDVFRTVAMQAPGRLRYVLESRLGKSRALNAGIAAARGAVVALTDDDVSPAVDWVATAATVLDKWGVDGAGGRILPRWEAEPPSWVLGSERLLSYLAIMRFDKPVMLPVPVGGSPQVWGANMVYRRSALLALGGFDPRLGPVGGKRYCDEDVDIVRRMVQSGRGMVYDPALTVFHRVPRARLRRSYFRRVMWDMGEGEALAATDVSSGPSVLGVPRWRFRLLARLAAHSTLRTMARRPEAFYDLLDCVRAAGVTWGQFKRGVQERRMRGVTERPESAEAVRAVRSPQ